MMLKPLSHPLLVWLLDLNNEHAALVEAGNQGQKMEGADSCLQFSSYNQQCCICVAQVLHWNPSPL